MTRLIQICVVLLVCVFVDGDIPDHTCFTADPIRKLDGTNDNALIGSYVGYVENDVDLTTTFGRVVDTGSGDQLNPGSKGIKYQHYVDKRSAVRQYLSVTSGNHRVGAFFCNSKHLEDDPSYIPLIILAKEAYVKPEKRTQTVSFGETVTINMNLSNGHVTDLRWRLNKTIMESWSGMANVTIEHVTKDDAGIYECYLNNTRNEGKHAIMRLIVRVAQLKLFFSSMRTRFGKLSKLKFGQGTPESFTERDQHIYNTFRFLDTHICRVPSRQSVKFPKRSELDASASTADEQHPCDAEIELSDEDSITPLPSQAHTKYKKSTISRDNTTELVKKLIQRADKAAEERKSLMTPTHKTAHEMAIHHYCEYLSTQVVEIMPELWLEFTMDVQRMVYNYRSKQTQHKLQPYAYHHQEVQRQQQEAQKPLSHSVRPNPPSSYTTLHTADTGYTQQQYHLPAYDTYNSNASSASEGESMHTIAQAMSFNSATFE